MAQYKKSLFSSSASQSRLLFASTVVGNTLSLCKASAVSEQCLKMHICRMICKSPFHHIPNTLCWTEIWSCGGNLNGGDCGREGRISHSGCNTTSVDSAIPTLRESQQHPVSFLQPLPHSRAQTLHTITTLNEPGQVREHKEDRS